MRFLKKNRLTRSSEFEEANRRGRRLHGRRFILVRVPNSEGLCRLGVVVTKKTGTAVIRNRWKRVIRETFRSYMDQASTSTDYVVVVRNSVHGYPDVTVREELRGLLLQKP